jgi:hypothetical protein
MDAIYSTPFYINCFKYKSPKDVIKANTITATKAPLFFLIDVPLMSITQTIKKTFVQIINAIIYEENREVVSAIARQNKNNGANHLILRDVFISYKVK